MKEKKGKKMNNVEKNENEKKKTYNHYKILVSNFSNKLATMEWELKSVGNYFNKEPYPRLYELFCYMLTWKKDVIGVDDNYFKIDITIKTLKDILISKFNYQWNNFRRDMKTLYKTTERIEIYSQKLNKTLSIAPIILTDILIDGRPVSKKQLDDFEAWESVVLLYDRRMFQYAYNGTEPHFTLPTTYSSYMKHYTKILEPIILEFAYCYDPDLIKTSPKTNEQTTSKKRPSYVTDNKAYAIINYLLDTSNDNETRNVARRSINLVDFAKRCNPYWIKKNKGGGITLRYKEIKIAIFQTLYIHNSILIDTNVIENRFIKLTCNINSLEIDKKERLAYIDIVNLKDLQLTHIISLCYILLTCEEYRDFVNKTDGVKLKTLLVVLKKQILKYQQVREISIGQYQALPLLEKIYKKERIIRKNMQNIARHYLKSLLKINPSEK